MPNSQEKRGKGSYMRERKRGRRRQFFTGTVIDRLHRQNKLDTGEKE
jgi:stalled ribosome alternative rescue factor ArfA